MCSVQVQALNNLLYFPLLKYEDFRIFVRLKIVLFYFALSLRKKVIPLLYSPFSSNFTSS